MASRDQPVRIPLRRLTDLAWGAGRRREPVTIGIPLPGGLTASTAEFLLETPHGARAVQARPLDCWPDGSFRWVLLDFLADSDARAGDGYTLVVGARADSAAAQTLRVVTSGGRTEVATGPATFAFEAGGAFPFSSVDIGGAAPVEPASSGFRVGWEGRRVEFRAASIAVREEGPLRAEIDVRGVAGASGPGMALEVSARVELFAGSTTARVSVTLRNPRRARHPGGYWELGDAGSVLLDSAVFVVTLTAPIRAVRCAPEYGDSLDEVDRPFEIYQESSGGDQWNASVHRNRDGLVPLRFRGYRVRSGLSTHSGDRASPVVVAETSRAAVAITMLGFWEDFPSAIAVGESAIECGFFPAQAPDRFELQGGEQKTRVFALAFGDEATSSPPLAWCHDPLRLYPSPAWCCETGAVPFLAAPAGESTRPYAELVALGLDPAVGFPRKRERADEFGWRHFGDLPADHESAFQPPDQPFVSHYNNQYDAIAGFGLQFLIDGDVRWWRLMHDLAHHVIDIDIYHTREDKAAYNGGLFWHTDHYIDAGTSTHRTYPRQGKSSGGPAAAHNYNTGLMLHYFLTGERASREAAIGLGQWVLDMDDGRRTVFRWLASGPTGVASFSADDYGPGRGAGNSIVACLVAYRLSQHPAFKAKCEELIRRSIHPDDDCDARGLTDRESRWSYVVFLQALGAYLHAKAEWGEPDEMYAYAQHSLLRYAAWMARHEYPYLDRPDQLEYPTETWAAQDMRKADVFLWAAIHASHADRPAFLERLAFFFQASVRTLHRLPGRHYTRPLVVLLSNGVRPAWFLEGQRRLPEPLRASAPTAWPPPTRFTPQKVVAMYRAKRLAGVTVAAGILLTGWLLLR